MKHLKPVTTTTVSLAEVLAGLDTIVTALEAMTTEGNHHE